MYILSIMAMTNKMVRIHAKTTGVQTETLELTENMIVQLVQKVRRFCSLKSGQLKQKTKKVVRFSHF